MRSHPVDSENDLAMLVAFWRFHLSVCAWCGSRLDYFHRFIRLGGDLDVGVVLGYLEYPAFSGSFMKKPEFRPSQVWGALVRDWKVDFISSSHLESAMESLSVAKLGLADESCPTCLVPVHLESKAPFSPVDCRKPAYRKSHSIQEAGPLKEISSPLRSGPCVLQVFPNIDHLVKHTKGENKRTASKWLWEIESMPPQDAVPISLASVAHFACDIHDQGYPLAGADNLKVPVIPGYVSFDDQSPPAGFEDCSESLFYLAYRTLLFRISQFRGLEREVLRQLGLQVESGNRFAVESCLGHHQEISSVISRLLRFKDGFDRRVLGDARAIRLVHHIVPFRPMIRYAACEFNTLSHTRYRGEDSVWAALNVLPISGRAWFLVSHFRLSNRHHYSLVRNRILEFAAYSSSARRAADLDALLSWINLYASITDYCSLPESDRTLIESQIAWQVCEEPFSKGLEILGSSPSGAREIARVKRELGSRS